MEVSTALFRFVKSLGKSGNGVMNSGTGRFTSFDHTGLLLKVMTKYHLWRFCIIILTTLNILKKFGFVKEADWLEWRIKNMDVFVPEQMARIAALVTENII